MDKDTPTTTNHYSVAYIIPTTGMWHKLVSLRRYTVDEMILLLTELKRPCRVKNEQNGTIENYGTEFAKLNLFSNRITDRNGQCTEQ